MRILYIRTMKIGFWNIRKKTDPNIRALITEWAKTCDLDIFVLLECKIPDYELEQVLMREGNMIYNASPSWLPKQHFTVFTKFDRSYSLPIKDGNRVQAREIIVPFVGRFSLVLVHYQSKLHWRDADQNAHLPELRRFIEDLEQQVRHEHTLVMGDFNMNPFEFGMVQTTGLHATMDKRMAMSGKRVVDGKEYKFFYNPMWSFFGEQGKGEVNGTYFYSASKPINYFWNIFDQVILRPSMLDAFDEDSLQVLTRIGERSLLNQQGAIDKNVSDHLPIVFKLNIKQLRDETATI